MNEGSGNILISEWAAIVVVIEVGVITMAVTARHVRRAFRWWVDWKTYRNARRLIVAASVLADSPKGLKDGPANPGNIVKFTAMFEGKDNNLMLWKYLSPVTFTPVGDLGLVPLEGSTVRPKAGYAHCDFVVTSTGSLGTVVAHSGPVASSADLKTILQV